MKRKQEKAYGLLINIIEDYNLRLLSTKIYWDKPQEKEEYKKFWNEYKTISELKNKDYMQYSKEREILFLRRELKVVYKNPNKYCRIEKFFKEKLVQFGVMKRIKNTYESDGRYVKASSENFKMNEMARAVSY